MSKLRILLLTVVLAAVGGLLLRIAILKHEVPRVDGFSSQPGHWAKFGGAWRLQGDVMNNDSTERGSKILTGNSDWQDYLVEADVALLRGYGDAGLLVRAQNVGRGVDSYEGFFAGIRSLDNTLILGRVDYGWKEYSAQPLPVTLEPGRFYHLEVVAVGCSIAARVTFADGSVIKEGVELSRCNRSGQIGLKSYQSPARWKNFRVRPASTADIVQIMDGTPLGSAKKNTLHRAAQIPDDMSSVRIEAIAHQIEGITVPIGQLHLRALTSVERVSIHGVVTLLSPAVFVEDGTGAAEIASSDATALAIGDEVEITGNVRRDANHVVLTDGHVKSLWSNDNVAPRMVVAAEAATGVHDDQLVALSGILIDQIDNPDGAPTLILQNGGETFRALTRPSQIFEKPISIPVGSEIELTGVVRSDRKYAGSTAFAVLLPPTDNAIRVLHEAPWWNVKHIAVLGLVLLLIVCAILIAYSAFKERHLLDLIEERERLAHDLHDTVAQSFAGIGYQLSAVQERLVSSTAPAAQLERARSMVRESHQELRKSITTLRSADGASNDLATELELRAKRLIDGGTLKVVSSTIGSPRRLPLLLADCFFRVGQEAISNAILHAKASTLSITMLYGPNHVQLRIVDDGCGLSTGQEVRGSGLFGMNRRAQMVGAHLTVDSSAGGTSITLEAPVPAHTRIISAILLRWFRPGGKHGVAV